jgi:copper chaperone CopZ
MKKYLAIAMMAFAVSCGNHSHEEETVQKEYNLAEMSAPATLTAQIEGMTCAMGCAKAIEKALLEVPGVVLSSVDFEAGVGTFSYEGSDLKTDDLVAAIEGVNNGAYTVLSKEVVDGIPTDKVDVEPESDIEALHSEKKIDEASV